MKIKFSVPYTPVPASRPKVSKFGTYYGKNHTKYKKQVTEYMKTIAEKPQNVTGEPVTVELILYISLPKSMSKKRIQELDGTFCMKGDIDNYTKLVFDTCLTGFFIKDDSQIVQSKQTKFWTKEKIGRTEIFLQNAI